MDKQKTIKKTDGESWDNFLDRIAGLELFPAISEDPILRCHLRWLYLWEGMVDALARSHPWVLFGLHEALKKFGLSRMGGIYPETKEINPSDTILHQAFRFSRSGEIPKSFKGKKYFKADNPYFILHDFSIAFSAFKDLPRKQPRLNEVKKIKAGVISQMINKVRRDIPDEELNAWLLFSEHSDALSNRDLALFFVAYIHRKKEATFQKQLTKAIKEEPNLAKLLGLRPRKKRLNPDSDAV